MKFKSFIILLLITLPSFALLFQKGYFSMHDDLQSLRQMELDKCVHDGQIPCRWVLDMGYGYGYPLFNYYPPFPYLVGQVFRTAGFAYIDVVKLVGITGFIATAAFMYLLGRKLWGEYGGLIASAVYTYAPYHSVDFYVRGAMNEFWAMAFYPATLWGSLNLIQTRQKRWISVTALAVAGIMLSHNPMLMIFAPVLMAWCLFWIVKTKNWRGIWTLSLAAIWALGLAAFFTLPVLAESKYVSLWTLTSGYFNYLAHFLNWRQIFLNINWGYGSSELGPADSMSFAVGYLQWIIPVLLLPCLLFFKKVRMHWPVILMLFIVVGVSLFMTHSKATELWKLLKPLEFLQFPWRFLTVAVFAASLVCGALGLVVGRKMVPIILVIAMLLNIDYFRPREWYPDMTDSLKFSGKSWQLLVTSGIFDYLPVYAPQPPADPALMDIKVLSGQAKVTTVAKTTNTQVFTATVTSASAVAQIQTYYFPGWRVWLDDEEVNIDPKKDPELGRMTFVVPNGVHTIEARFTNTPVRTIGNLVSVVAWATLFGTMVIWWKKRALLSQKPI